MSAAEIQAQVKYALAVEIEALERQALRWSLLEKRAVERRDYLFAHECKTTGDRWQAALDQARDNFSRGSAETSRSCGHTASSGAAGANVALETANHSVRGAGGVS